jgi:hypothetical protein
MNTDQEGKMDAWLKSFGEGDFTCGATYLCFLPKGAGDDGYQKIAQAPTGTEDSSEWAAFAEHVTDYLNELLDIQRTPDLWVREVDGGTDNACWVVCAKGDPGARPAAVIL